MPELPASDYIGKGAGIKGCFLYLSPTSLQTMSRLCGWGEMLISLKITTGRKRKKSSGKNMAQKDSLYLIEEVADFDDLKKKNRL